MVVVAPFAVQAAETRGGLLSAHQSQTRTVTIDRSTMGWKMTEVVLIAGDGIGCEVVAVARRVLEATRVPLTFIDAVAGEQIFATGNATGVPQETIDEICRVKLVLKGPLGTQLTSGGKSANVTLRKMFEMYANIRPIKSWPAVEAHWDDVDLVIVRENIEDLYAGIEHRQSRDVFQSLKVISRPGCDRINKMAFEYAQRTNRAKVACATKANIMKFTEGTMKTSFETLALTYPDIAARHVLVDDCAHQLAKNPHQFDVIVTTNMNGDILSDLAAGLVGGLGLAPSANIGADCAMFEAVHGTAPDIAGLGMANPTAEILAAAMMLEHLGYIPEALAVRNAVAAALRSGAKTRDLGGLMSTSEYADAVIGHLVLPDTVSTPTVPATVRLQPTAEMGTQPCVVEDVGVDVFLEHDGSIAELVQNSARVANIAGLKLVMVENRGTCMFPTRPVSQMELSDVSRCRFMLDTTDDLDSAICTLLLRLRARWVHIERLRTFDGVPGFSKAQGEP